MKEILRFPVAGVQYHDYQLVVGLKAGRVCKLHHEKNNEFDENAIAITIDSVKIGHVPAKHTEELHEYRRDRIKLFAFVAAYNKNNPSWSAIHVKIMIKAPKAKLNKDVDFE